MKPHELRQLTDAELEQRILENNDALATMQFQKATSQVENTAKFTSLRKDTARMKTILRERALSKTSSAPQQ
jgi:large subunit ribosomal protein L29